MKKALFAVVIASIISVSPCIADDEDIMLAVDALTGLGFSTDCLQRLHNRPMDTATYFKSTLKALDENFERVYGITLTNISLDVMHSRPEAYIAAADKQLERIKTEEELRKVCLKSMDKFRSSFVLLTLKGKH